jgi:hypothetical protein
MRYSTQWRVGAGGVVGLDYSVIQHDLDHQGVQGEQYDEVMYAMHVIEQAALKAINEK